MVCFFLSRSSTFWLPLSIPNIKVWQPALVMSANIFSCSLQSTRPSQPHLIVSPSAMIRLQIFSMQAMTAFSLPHSIGMPSVSAAVMAPISYNFIRKAAIPVMVWLSTPYNWHNRVALYHSATSLLLICPLNPM